MAASSSTSILPCSCEHEFQNKTYGRGQRVHNMAPGSDRKKTNRWRCTVCSNIRESGPVTEVALGKKGSKN